jgi:hypothetical protein
MVVTYTARIAPATCEDSMRVCITNAIHDFENSPLLSLYVAFSAAFMLTRIASQRVRILTSAP